MKGAMTMKATLTIILATLTLAGCAQSTAQTTQMNNTEMVERGKYLVTIGGCNDCHTPFKLGPNGPEPDMTRMLSGHPQDVVMPAAAAPEMPWGWTGAITNTAFAGPWGVSYAFNLTPHEDSGIGIWTEDIFMKTIRSGRHWGVSRPILPPMPWFNYREMTDDDLRAVFAYLRTIPPIHNRVPQPIIAGEITE
jgi:mono/diheme cytochrome c family protein